MKALFCELSSHDRADGLDLRAHVLSETDGRRLAVVLRLAANRGRFGSREPVWICGCWPAATPRYDCQHILAVKAALEQAQPQPPAAA